MTYFVRNIERLKEFGRELHNRDYSFHRHNTDMYIFKNGEGRVAWVSVYFNDVNVYPMGEIERIKAIIEDIFQDYKIKFR